MRITVGMLAFNVENTLPRGMFEACVNQIYDVADEIIIVEGATLATTHYWDGNSTWATKDGKSTDSTRVMIEGLKDPSKKIKTVLATRFWNGKTQMCNQWAQLATGDYIWQVDTDEFYHEKDIPKIFRLLDDHKPDAVHFYAHHFFGNFQHCVDEKTGKGWGNDIPWMRIFRHTPGSYWQSHEPPAYILQDAGRKISCNSGKVADRDFTLAQGIRLYHYGYICKQQVDFKTRFFNNSEIERAWSRFGRETWTHLVNGATAVEFKGEHPREIRKLLKI